MTSVNVYTKNVLEKCMGMVEPALSVEQLAHLTRLMETYVASEQEGDFGRMDETETVYTVDQHLISRKRETKNAEVDVTMVGEKTFGIWSEVSG